MGQFTARLIVAADLQNSGPAPTGTIAGTVTSPQLGTLNGVDVTATSGITSLSGTTAGAGAYSIGSVPTGPASATITSGLPAGCTNPGSQATTVTNGGTSTVNFTVTCPVPTGTRVWYDHLHRRFTASDRHQRRRDADRWRDARGEPERRWPLHAVARFRSVLVPAPWRCPACRPAAPLPLLAATPA